MQDIIQTKTCTKCGLEKPIKEFYKNSQAKDGHRPDCRTCSKSTTKQYYINNKDKVQEYVKLYNEKNRKSRLEYYKEYNKTKRDPNKESYRRKVYYEKNKEEIRNKARAKYEIDKEYEHERKRKYYYENHEYVRVLSRRYYDNNKENIKKYRNKKRKEPKSQKWRLTPEFYKWRQAVYTKYNFTCQACNATNCELHAHHIKPAAEFPELRLDESNGICLCAECHRNEHRKSRSLPVGSSDSNRHGEN